jgi:hypothetical protein
LLVQGGGEFGQAVGLAGGQAQGAGDEGAQAGRAPGGRDGAGVEFAAHPDPAALDLGGEGVNAAGDIEDLGLGQVPGLVLDPFGQVGEGGLDRGQRLQQIPTHTSNLRLTTENSGGPEKAVEGLLYRDLTETQLLRSIS